MSKLFVKSLKIIFFYLLLLSNSLSEIITDIKISGNQRISNETIILFSDIKKNNEVNNNDLNQILKNLYGTNFFKDISLEIKNRVLYINVIELPLIQSVKFEGLKAKKFVEPIKSTLVHGLLGWMALVFYCAGDLEIIHPS